MAQAFLQLFTSCGVISCVGFLKHPFFDDETVWLNCISYACYLTFEFVVPNMPYAMSAISDVFCLSLASRCRIHVLVKLNTRKVQNPSDERLSKAQVHHDSPPFNCGQVWFSFPGSGSRTIGLQNLQANICERSQYGHLILQIWNFHWIRSSWPHYPLFHWPSSQKSYIKNK